jgi:hypothetical protein
MAPEEASKGANVIRKGYSAGRSQFKLQVDGIAGRPSCVLAGVGSSRIYAATANRTVADGQWHQVGCAREGGLRTVTIDNATVGRVALPTILSVENEDPLRVDGKGGAPNNDQFNGILDEAHVYPGPQ